MVSIQTFVYVLTSYSFINPACGYVPEEDLFPFGIDEGDSMAPPADDAFAGPIQLRYSFPFFNKTQTQLFVNNNGAISFARGVREFTPICGALKEELSMIAPYWSDVDNGQGLGGVVYYRESIDPSLRMKAGKEIQNAFPNMWGLQINSVFISTWHRVTFFEALKCGKTNTTAPRNTFQTILATDGVRSFAIFYYNNITWTTGRHSTSGGDCSGLGGHTAKAGFDVGDGKTFYEVPASCTKNIIQVGESSNIDFLGKYIFRIDNQFESASCDSQPDPDEKLRIDPPFVTLFGQIPIKIKGPCFDESYNAICIFNDRDLKIEVPAKIQIADSNPRAICQVPYLNNQGRIDLDLILESQDAGSTSSQKYSGYLYVNEMEEDVKVKIFPSFDNTFLLRLTWDRSFFENTTENLELALLEYDIQKKTWIEKLLLPENISNTGSTELTIRSQNYSISFLTFSLRKRSATAATMIAAASRLFGPLSVTASAYWYDADKSCDQWYKTDPGTPRDILPCPPLLTQVLEDERFESDQSPLIDFFHSGADYSFRQRTPSSTGAGQQCTYQNGQLLFGPPGGGTADFVSPNKNFLGHWINDVLPWFNCCEYSKKSESCYKYYEKRPSDSGIDYVPPRPARGTGDPHITTFDLASYTFNGVGEFWMIKSVLERLINQSISNNRSIDNHRLIDDHDFSMQARMEQYQDPNGQPMPASVFTAFVVKDIDLSIQVQLSTLTNIDVLINGDLIDFGSTANKKRNKVIMDRATIVIDSDGNRVSASFASGYEFVFAKFENSLQLSAMTNQINQNKTWGLLGYYDGDSENDLQSRDGKSIELNSSLEIIHKEFGLTWMITEEESIFTYGPGKNYLTYENREFAPNFLKPDLNSIPEDVLEMCSGIDECLYDYSTTKNRLFANRTKSVVQQFNATLNILTEKVEMCQSIEKPLNGFLNVSNFFQGSIASFDCYQGYDLVGNRQIECTHENQWTGTTPVCQKRNGGHKIKGSIMTLFGCIIAFFLSSY